MLLLRSAAACSKHFGAASAHAARSLCTTTASSSGEPTRGRTAGELGVDAADSMSPAADKASHAGDRVEPKVSGGGFEVTDDAIPSPDTAGRSGGVGADVMGDMMGMMGAAVKGDDKRAARDVADMARQQNSDAHTGAGSKPPHTTAQDWPRGSITDPAASPNQPAGPDSIGEAPFVSTDEASGAGVDRYEGTIPRVDPSEELPEVDQDPPEAAAAGPTPGYSGRGGDTRPI